MKQYRIVKEDGVLLDDKLTWPEGEGDEAMRYYERYFIKHPSPRLHGVCRLELHEFETDAEADGARLDFIERTRAVVSRIGPMENAWDVYFGSDEARGNGQTIREAIDAARNAPKPKVTVLATPEGSV